MSVVEENQELSLLKPRTENISDRKECVNTIEKTGQQSKAN